MIIQQIYNIHAQNTLKHSKFIEVPAKSTNNSPPIKRITNPYKCTAKKYKKWEKNKLCSTLITKQTFQVSMNPHNLTFEHMFGHKSLILLVDSHLRDEWVGMYDYENGSFKE